MVVACPKCKTKLKVDETRLSPAGSRFKCPRCATVLLVKKPAAAPARKELDKKLVLVAHEKPELVQRISTLLQRNGYRVTTSADGIDVMVKALKDLPAFAIVEVALPKIYGFEICKRLKSRPETKEMKVILVPSIHDRSKYRRDPSSLYGADEYLEEHHIESDLMQKVNKLAGVAVEEPEVPKPPAMEPEQKTPQAPSAAQQAPAGAAAEPSKIKIVVPEKKPEPAPVAPAEGEDVERARRLSRTILNDIYLYNVAKVDEAIRNNEFEKVFSSELKEGLKLYDNRIPPDTKKKGDFFRETLTTFLASKKK